MQRFFERFPCLIIYLWLLLIFGSFLYENQEYVKEGIFGIVFVSLLFTTIYAIMVNFMKLEFWNKLLVLFMIAIVNSVFAIYISICNSNIMTGVVTMCTIVAQVVFLKLMQHGKVYIRVKDEEGNIVSNEIT